MIESKRRGKLIVSKELYHSNSINKYLECLKVKVHSMEYKPFQDWYELFIVSEFLPEVNEGVEVEEFLIEILDMGCQFKRRTEIC